MDTPMPHKKRLVIVGATGMVGGYALRFALEDPAVRWVTAVGRRRLGISHPKLSEVVHQDFSDCSSLAKPLYGQDAAIFCLGAYTGAVSDTQLREVTVDYPIEFARALHLSSPGSAFSFLSGSGADPSGRSRMAFARYKGEAETALLKTGFSHVYIFRPAYIYPVEPRKEPNLGYRVLRTVYPVFRTLFPNQVIPADDLARAMVEVVLSQNEQGPVFENSQIRTIVGPIHGTHTAAKGRT
jgi:uncharacterized protein YbjT (DUF2867 family)